jgi:hypothetical protein
MHSKLYTARIKRMPSLASTCLCITFTFVIQITDEQVTLPKVWFRPDKATKNISQLTITHWGYSWWMLDHYKQTAFAYPVYCPRRMKIIICKFNYIYIELCRLLFNPIPFHSMTVFEHWSQPHTLIQFTAADDKKQWLGWGGGPWQMWMWLPFSSNNNIGVTAETKL